MSDTTRLTFEVEDLRKQITDRRDERIARAAARRDRALDLEGRVADWRKEQEKRIKDLARNIGTKPDSVLSGFKVPSAPSWGDDDGWSRRDPNAAYEKEVLEATTQSENYLRRLNALTTKSGSISLTAKMLSDYFNL